MSPLLRKYGLLAAVAAAALATGLLASRQARSLAPPPAAAHSAADLTQLTLPDLSGTPQALSRWRGKIWVVNFWATWCAPCREEMPLLENFARQHAERVQVIGIGIDEPQAMRDFLTQTTVTYPLLVGNPDTIPLTARLGNTAMVLPFTVVLDARGALKHAQSGRLTEEDLARLTAQ